MLKSKLPYWMYKAQILFKSNYLDPKIVINWLSAKWYTTSKYFD